MLRMILVIIKHYKRMTIDEAEMKQDEFNVVLGVLSI